MMLSFISEVVNCLRKGFVTKQAIDKIDDTILQYKELAEMTLIKNDDVLYAKSCKVSDDYNKWILNEMFNVRFIPSIYHNLRKYRTTHQHVNVTNIAYKAKSLLVIQEIYAETIDF